MLITPVPSWSPFTFPESRPLRTLAGDLTDLFVVPVDARRRNRLSYTYVRTCKKIFKMDVVCGWRRERGLGLGKSGETWDRINIRELG